MHAIWASLKQNVNCGSSRWTDVVRQPEKMGTERRYIFKKENLGRDILHHEEEQACEVIFRQNHSRDQYCELNIRDPSRNIIEMIFQAASRHPSKHCRKIKKVLRVNNPVEMVERFEKYREMVKKRAHEQHNRHLRSTVDGNELLQFYGTTMNCCSRKPSKGLSKACTDQTCRVCRIIQSGFNTAYLKKNGIHLSTSSEELSEDFINIAEVKNVKKAVIVCRTIAGTVGNVGDEEYDSIKIGGIYSKSEYLIVQNPSAVLSCFVVVLK